MAHPSFIISKSKNEMFYFNLTAKNGQVILTSEQYSSKSACNNGIDSVKTNSTNASRFEKLDSNNDKFYFNLKAANGQIIGTSQMYTTASSRDNGIASVTTNAPNADIEDNA